VTKRQSLAGIASTTLDTEELVKQYMPLVRQIAKRYSRVSPGSSDEDLMQVGCIGLLKAIRAYEPDRTEKKASFKTFALLYIKGEIRHYLRDHASLVQVPRRLNEISTKIVQLEEALTKELEHTPSAHELAERSGYSVADVREAQQSWDLCNRYESLDATEDGPDGREEARALAELLADRRHLDEIGYSEDREVISQALINLGEKTRQIIEFVYFYDLTQKETAKILGVSEMGVSRAVRSALGKLKEILFTEIL